MVIQKGGPEEKRGCKVLLHMFDHHSWLDTVKYVLYHVCTVYIMFSSLVHHSPHIHFV